jgi:hypothetical protein
MYKYKILIFLLIITIQDSTSANAMLIEYDISVNLNDGQNSANGWWYTTSQIPTYSINDGDTVRLNFDFSNQRLRWVDNGSNNEYVMVSLFSSANNIQVDYDQTFLWSKAVGDYTFDTVTGLSGSGGGGIGGNTIYSGLNNVTDSFFDISGLSFEMANLRIDQSSGGPTGLPALFQTAGIFFEGGDFSVYQVPEPSTLLLMLLGIFLITIRKYYRKMFE